MAIVRALLEIKGSTVWTVSFFTPVHDALKMMAEHKIGAVMVIQDGQIAGIFSERDFARKSISISDFSVNLAVNMLMSRPVFYVLPSQTIEECMTLMTEKHVRHLPVVDEGVLIGIVSIGDVVKHLMQEKHAAIRDLESYIHKNIE
jgi:signal-transduction protein with cAMP-binding, CBS, and nucleotidyltransferase domain